jgi:hypothetical protein
VRLRCPKHAQSNLPAETRPRTRVSPGLDLPPLSGIPGMERIPVTLKLFVVSDVWRRNAAVEPFKCDLIAQLRIHENETFAPCVFRDSFPHPEYLKSCPWN